MAHIIKHRGGARVGWLHASWPFAAFHANKEEISLDIGFSDKYVFRAEQVIGIEKYGSVPFLGWGIQIKHAISDYPENIVFYCFVSPEKILDELRSLGFIAKASSAQIRERSGFPIRWEVLAFIVVAWNVLFMLDFGQNFLGKREVTFGPFIFFATFGVFVFSLCALRFKYIQELILKPGRSIGEIKSTLRLVSWISGALALASLLGTVFIMIDKYG